MNILPKFVKSKSLNFASVMMLFFTPIMVLFSSVPVSAAISTQNFTFSNFTADYYLEKTNDGTSKLHVKEVLTAEFPNSDQNHGITREIPLTNQDGANIVISNQSALNFSVLRNGQPEPYSIEEQSDVYLVKIGDAGSFVHGTQTYTLEYDFYDVITEFDKAGNNVSGQEGNEKSFQELYWDTNGTGWKQSFDQVSATLHMPSDVFSKITKQPSCYVGSYGSKGQNRCTVTKVTDGYTFTAEYLGAGENLTYAVDFAPDTFKVILDKDYTFVIFLAVEIIVILIILAIIYIFWIKSAKANHALYKSTFVAPEYLPPADITIAEAQQLSVKKIKISYVATLLELAVAKKITVTSEKGKTYDWSITLNVAPETLTASQVDVLQILAGNSNLTTGSFIPITRHTATPTLARYAENYQKSAIQLLGSKGYFVPKSPAKQKSIGIIILIFMIIMIIAVIIGSLSPSSSQPIVRADTNDITVGGPIVLFLILAVTIGGIVAISIFITKTSKFSKYTEKGIKKARELEGLELYIKMAETERIKFLQSVQGADTSTTGIVKLYEELLPWAALFGLEKSWAKELYRYYEMNNVYDTNVDRNLLNGLILSNMVGDVNRSISRSTHYSSGSSSSSSSGGGGGGFSGGGGGGGGGGGW